MSQYAFDVIGGERPKDQKGPAKKQAAASVGSLFRFLDHSSIVAVWHLADIPTAPALVRFWTKADLSCAFCDQHFWCKAEQPNVLDMRSFAHSTPTI